MLLSDDDVVEHAREEVAALLESMDQELRGTLAREYRQPFDSCDGFAHVLCVPRTSGRSHCRRQEVPWATKTNWATDCSCAETSSPGCCPWLPTPRKLRQCQTALNQPGGKRRIAMLASQDNAGVHLAVIRMVHGAAKAQIEVHEESTKGEGQLPFDNLFQQALKSGIGQEHYADQAAKLVTKALLPLLKLPTTLTPYAKTPKLDNETLRAAIAANVDDPSEALVYGTVHEWENTPSPKR